ncbi:MAG: rRNA-binding ribosome biosynthesis protein utp25 [Caeruleum heppii]|nr:MAG: rRNA-binding ribosome biosynthesis protein utp25 [Caeruleum heppii]
MPGFRGSRGRGRGRGTARGRGGSRGGRGGRGGRKPSFHTNRIAQDPQEYVTPAMNKDSDASQTTDDASEPEEDAIDGDVSSESDRTAAVAIPAFSALMQSLAAERKNDAPRKKRKLEEDIMHKSRMEASVDEETKSPYGSNEELPDSDINGPAEVSEPEASENEADVEDLLDAADPFDVHFANPDDNVLAKRLKAVSSNGWIVRRSSGPAGKATIYLAPEATEPLSHTPNEILSTHHLNLKSKLVEPAAKLKPDFNPLERAVASYIFNYQDLMVCNRTLESARSFRTLYSLHALNHIFKTRDRVIKNNERLSKADGGEDLELRDQGFTRPKVLMLLPTKHSCVQAVETISALCGTEQQENRKRFDDDYVQTEEKFSSDKAEDFRELFQGNDDDMFRLGLKFTRKTMKLYTHFYSADIIFASPLGLRMAVGDENDKKQDYDFLSSIELVVVDQADALLMQNWEHVEYIFEHLNLQPREPHGCDFGRVRSWYLDGQARHLRQTLILSAFNTPELNSLFGHQMHNLSGKVKITLDYAGAMLDLGLSTKQTFSRYESPDLTKDPDARFEYFSAAIVPSLAKFVRSTSGPAGAGILIFVPSYLDFVRIRNYFSTSAAAHNISFGAISEYSSVPDVARARSHFFSGRHSVLLYTERAHHFRRYLIRGVKRVVLYGMPDNPIFYREIVGGYLGASVKEGRLGPDEGVARSMFSRWDGLKLERIVGTKRVGTLLKRTGGDTFDFV